ncbi:hypothetical protein OS123_11050 [Corynebacterium sp. P5875]|uniref:Uncharacterized protein n=1 Tax=Corynebacterium antarcticum TaxID=2800405 RepID=A0A9Q4CDV8_9CORY|nr:hypothetical protein [Corynebacterium antarcticum]MCX7539069.1 hypothetical protein [Corynebacterium antarcticum]
MDREELKQKIDELMHKYQEREIDSETYATEMMNLTASAQEPKIIPLVAGTLPKLKNG